MSPVSSRLDVLLLALVCLFAWTKAGMIGWGGPLGRSMTGWNVAIGATYGFSAYLWSRLWPALPWLPPWPPETWEQAALLGCRLAVAGTALWALKELWRYRPWAWRRDMRRASGRSGRAER